MCVSLNGAHRSNSPSQRSIEDALREIGIYYTNVSNLECFLDENLDVIDKHVNLTKTIQNTITKTFETLERAEKLVHAHKNQSTTTRFRKKFFGSREWEDYEKLQQVMEENNSQVQRHFRQMKGAISSQQPAPPDLYERLINWTMPIAESYDEGLCEFSDLDSQA